MIVRQPGQGGDVWKCARDGFEASFQAAWGLPCTVHDLDIFISQHHLRPIRQQTGNRADGQCKEGKEEGHVELNTTTFKPTKCIDSFSTSCTIHEVLSLLPRAPSTSPIHIPAAAGDVYRFFPGPAEEDLRIMLAQTWDEQE